MTSTATLMNHFNDKGRPDHAEALGHFLQAMFEMDGVYEGMQEDLDEENFSLGDHFHYITAPDINQN